MIGLPAVLPRKLDFEKELFIFVFNGTQDANAYTLVEVSEIDRNNGPIKLGNTLLWWQWSEAGLSEESEFTGDKYATGTVIMSLNDFRLSKGLEIRLFGYNVYSYPLAITYEYHIPDNEDKGKQYFKILFDF